MSRAGQHGGAGDSETERLSQNALVCGVNHLDTADLYGWGQSEEVVGRAIKGRRDEVVLATKFGQVKREGGGNGVDGRPEYVAEAFDACLKRLGVDTIDIFYLHRVDPGVRIEDTVGAMAKLVQDGKVRALGLSEARPETIRRAHKIHPIAVVQTEYSLLYRQEAEETLMESGPSGVNVQDGALSHFSSDDGRGSKIGAP